MCCPITAQKAQLRTQMRARARQLSPQVRQQADLAIATRLLSLPAWQQAHTVFLFVSMGTEPHTHLLLHTALAQGKRVCVPLCLSDGIMQARQITAFSQLTPQQYGILAPTADCPLVHPQELDLVVVPCVATSACGQRLGNGGGYYDRYLPQVNCPTLCLCRGDLVAPTLPLDRHDATLTGVISEHGLLLCKPSCTK